MLFEKVFVENSVQSLPITQNILHRLKVNHAHPIEKYDDVFGKVKKPYIQKRQSLNLFIARKKGQLVKQAPDAYGLSGEPHYYFIHAYNCIYECEYCYLQGYFNSPDIVLFVNHDEIKSAIVENYNKHNGSTVWFHAGEFSDSLALSHITGECEFYYNTFKELPNAKLELRTKSANIKALKEIPALPNIITSLSMSPADQIKSYDRKTATLKQRLMALDTLKGLNHPVAIHLDPIIYCDDFESQYTALINDLDSRIGIKNLEYISLGVVRFTKGVYKEVLRNYPESNIHSSEFVTSFDDKVRYSRPHRLFIMNKIKQLLLDKGFPETKLYLCME